MTHELRLFFVALQFLTRLPVPRWVGFDPCWLQSCSRHFPLVGALVGTWSALVLWGSLLFWPPFVAAVLSLIATAWLTGAFHEDGLADTFDALGGSVSRERALAIMKDSRIGSYGAVALVLALGLKVAVVAALVDGAPAGRGTASAMAWAAAALMWSHAVSRAAPVWVISRLSYVGDVDQAKARPLATRVSGAGLWVAAGWLVVVGAAVTFGVPPSAGRVPMAVGAALSASALTTLCCTRWLLRRLGGFTGDTLGATQQLVELAGLLAWLAVARWGHA